jgi:hypothetical protein
VRASLEAGRSTVYSTQLLCLRERHLMHHPDANRAAGMRSRGFFLVAAILRDAACGRSSG